jgi:hypothetical protein
MAFYDAFFGSDQSLYTAYAIIAAIIAICITILLTATDISVGNRILIVLFVIVTLIPSIFLTLFEITCMVTGGTEPNRWWCYAFAWILAAFIIIYCVFVVIISLISLFTYNNAIDNVNEAERKNKLSDTDSNHIAKQIIHSEEEKKKLENFYNAPQSNEQFKGDRPTVNKKGDAGGVFNCPPGSKLNINTNRCVAVSKFENIENFGAEPMNELLPAPVPVPPPTAINTHDESFANHNEGFESHSKGAKFTNHDESFANHTEGFESYDGNSKAYFSDFSLNGASDLVNNFKDNARNSFNASFGSNF